MDHFFFGLLAWIGVGLSAGLLAPPLLPGAPRLGRLGAAATGVGGAVAGGLFATWLGFGGLAGFDWRGALFACLCAMIAVLLLRSATLREEV